MSIMRQDWHHLLFLHWEVSARELQALVPPELTIDTFDGKAYVGLIPFTLSNVRPEMLPPVPFLSNFHEINVRTYVHHQGREPGVWFFSLDTSSALAVEAARAFYKLPYFHSAIEWNDTKEPLPELTFVSHRDDPAGAQPANARVRYRPAEGATTRAVPGTLDHFFVERYVLYAMSKERVLSRARVHHEPYPIQPVDVLELDETLVWAAGIRRPENVAMRHYARGVSVRIDAPEQC